MKIQELNQQLEAAKASGNTALVEILTAQLTSLISATPAVKGTEATDTTHKATIISAESRVWKVKQGADVGKIKALFLVTTDTNELVTISEYIAPSGVNKDTGAAMLIGGSVTYSEQNGENRAIACSLSEAKQMKLASIRQAAEAGGVFAL